MDFEMSHMQDVTPTLSHSIVEPEISYMTSLVLRFQVWEMGLGMIYNS